MLPPQAEAEARLIRDLTDAFAAWGYERVSTPLVEFETSLVGRLGAERARDMFRFMDPVSRETLGLRTDMTAQVARVATTRLGHWPRPLRLSYAGSVVRVRGSQLRADRQFTQAGIELIGDDGVEAVAETIALLVRALAAVGVTDVSLDLAAPDVDLLAAAGLTASSPDWRAAVLACLDAKDMGGLTALGAEALAPVIQSAGPVDRALTLLRDGGLAMPALDRIAALVERLRILAPGLALTLDLGEQRGFTFQSWVGFSLFARGVRGEFGRGGAYAITHADGRAEPACGFSLYLDGLVEAGRGVQERRRLLVPANLSPAQLDGFVDSGWAIVRALDEDVTHSAAQTRRCAGWWDGQGVRSV